VQGSAQPAWERWHRAAAWPRVPGKGCWVPATPQHLVRLLHQSLRSSSVPKTTQATQKSVREGWRDGYGHCRPLQPPWEGVCSPLTARETSGSQASPAPRHHIAFATLQPAGCHGFTHASLLKLHRRAAQPRQNPQKSPCSVSLPAARGSLLAGTDARVPAARQRDESPSPGASSPRSTAPRQLPPAPEPAPALLRTLSPSLRWQLVAEQSHLHRAAFSAGFFPAVTKNTVEKTQAKRHERNGEEAAEVGSAVPVPAGRPRLNTRTAAQGQSPPRVPGSAGVRGAAPSAALGIPAGTRRGGRGHWHPRAGWELLPVLACAVPAIGVCHGDVTPSALL